ncbi:hypothetical protein ACFL3S_13425 [Gemmatimonadota bacterium]
MTDPESSTVARQLAKRVTSLRRSTAPVPYFDTPIPGGLPAYLREHLAAGETHYTTRPGLTELRRAIAREIRDRGGPDRNADSVIVTHGEGEALYVTLLGLGIGDESIVVVAGDCGHRGLLDLMGIEVAGPDDQEAEKAQAFYREVGEEPGHPTQVVRDDCVEILALGDLLFSGRSPEADLEPLSRPTIFLGHFDSLPGLDHFRMAYVAGPPELVKRIQTWKQALSICSAAPSQRAAMFATSRERVS